MSHRQQNYTPAELDRVKRLLADILTISTAEATALMRAHRHVVKKLAIGFEDMNTKAGQNWAESVLAKVSLSAWEETFNNESRIRPSKSASLRFLSRGAPSENAIAVRELRRSLHSDLLENMPGPLRLGYRPMLEWEETDGACPEASDLLLSSDTAFGQSLRAISELFNLQLYAYEQDFRRNSDFPPGITTPVKVSMHYSKRAYKYIAAQIEQMCVLESDVPDSIKESLNARVSANISCNRALLEYAAKEARGLEALEMCIPFVQRLNFHGLYMVPGDFLDATDGGTEYLRHLLTDWFTVDGALTKIDPYFKRHMTNSDVELIVSWSEKLQEAYIGTVGMGPNCEGRDGKEKIEQQARAAHGTPLNRFIFGMVLAAAYYQTTQTKREFTGHSKSNYSVFPARGEPNRSDSTPSIHAEELLMQSYGQIMFANIDWELRADNLIRYAQKRSTVRSHIQQLLHFAVKNRTSRQLYALFQELRRLKKQPEEPQHA